jgi:sulfite exporter TauE/SafE
LDAFVVGAFLVGLMSALHCIGMCGGIIGTLSFSLPGPVRNSRRRMLPYILAYNLGRIASYTIDGALAGGLGAGLSAAAGPQRGYPALQVLAALMLAAIAFHLAGWFPRFAVIERIGVPLWKRLQPLGRRLLPVRTPWHAVLFGLVWGWLPCGLVYSVLAWTTAAGGAYQGAVYMLAFGLGTLPSVAGGGLFAAWFMNLPRRWPWLRQGVAVLILVMAAAGLYVNLVHGSGMAGAAPGNAMGLH